MIAANLTLIEIALADYGMVEVKGTNSNPQLLAMIRKYLPNATDDSEVSWCGVFMSHVVGQLPGGNALAPAGRLAARNWLNAGQPVQPDEAKLGDIVVFYRGSIDGWQGHVGLLIKKDATKVWCLGGNQSDQVSILTYPLVRVLGFRRIFI